MEVLIVRGCWINALPGRRENDGSAVSTHHPTADVPLGAETLLNMQFIAVEFSLLYFLWIFSLALALFSYGFEL
ncbi:Uncharacterized protein HZ326_22993 [Fusarium oxysporum f. sp. albedinis]|nr:Uncharacterized protein HZ326_22993 [Fusarium oxysporum f. sp. albedinis]